MHLHSTHATAVSCLASPGDEAPIPPLTPYFVMRVGRSLPIVRYYRPGDPAMEGEIHAMDTPSVRTTTLRESLRTASCDGIRVFLRTQRVPVSGGKAQLMDRVVQCADKVYREPYVECEACAVARMCQHRDTTA